MTRKRPHGSGSSGLRAGGPGRASRAPSGPRAVLFPVALALVPILFFILLEVVLSIAGYGVRTDLVLEVNEPGIHLCVLNPDVGRRYFPPRMRSIQPTPGFRAFPPEKPAGGFRAFALGGSTTAGFPFHVNASFPGFLEDALRARFPGRSIDVINCGMTAINSFTVLDFVSQLVEREPDLLIVYMGHNEFYGALGAGAANRSAGSRGITLLQMKLARLRTYQLASAGMDRARRALAGGRAPAGRTLMASMVREKQIRLGDRVHRVAETNFRANLDAILDIARAHNVPVILSTLTSNLRDLAPFGSAHREGLSPADRERADALLARARGRSDAIGDLEAAVAADSTYADARFALGRALDRAGRAAEARSEYIAARDHDVVHFRACSRMNEIVRDVAARRGAPLVDMEAAFAARSPDGIPGRGLFLEHLHPNLDGAMLMADAFEAAIEAMGLIAPAPWPEGAARSREDRIWDACVTPLDLELARLRIAALTRQWPFDKAYAGLPSPYPPAREDVRRIGEQVLRKQTTLEKAHEILGREYATAGELESALAEFCALAKIFPVVPTGARLSGDILMQLGRPDEAAAYYGRAVSAAPQDAALRRRLDAAVRSAGAGAPPRTGESGS
jgi:lysophospholipase L1-like esterase